MKMLSNKKFILINNSDIYSFNCSLFFFSIFSLAIRSENNLQLQIILLHLVICLFIISINNKVDSISFFSFILTNI